MKYRSNIHSELKPLILGEDRMQIEFLTHKMEHLLLWDSFSGYPISAIDMALYDMKGKKLGVPVYELLGGCPAKRWKLQD